MRKISNYIRDQDMFGHTVAVQFDNKGNQHKSHLGGCISILFLSFIFWYIAVLFGKMIAYEDDKLTNAFSQQKFSELGENGVVEMQNKDLAIYF